MRLIFLSMGGVLGTITRYQVNRWIQKTWLVSFPLGTLAVNVLGCFMVGIFMALCQQKNVNETTHLFFVTGFCGAFTTFSALILESALLIRGENWGLAALNLFGSLFLGFAAFFSGALLIKVCVPSV